MAWDDAMYAQLELADWFSRNLHSRLAEQGQPQLEAATTVASHIYFADPFSVTPDVVTLLEAGERTLPSAIIYPEDVPCWKGWVYYERPIRIRADQSFTDDNYVALRLKSGIAEPYIDLRAFCFVDERRCDDPKDTIGVTFWADGWRGEGKLGYFEIAHYGYGLEQFVDGDDDHRGQMRAILQRHVATFLHFVKQRMERRTAEESVPPIRVVQLRKRDYSKRQGGEGAIDWSCQWLVHGFWRQQFYPSSGEHRARWIHDYTKGPPDRPFKGAERTAYEVKR